MNYKTFIFISFILVFISLITKSALHSTYFTIISTKCIATTQETRTINYTILINFINLFALFNTAILIKSHIKWRCVVYTHIKLYAISRWWCTMYAKRRRKFIHFFLQFIFFFISYQIVDDVSCMLAMYFPIELWEWCIMQRSEYSWKEKKKSHAVRLDDKIH